MKQILEGPFAQFHDIDPLPPVCRECGNILDACTSCTGSDRPPKAGSLSICAGCGTLSVYEDDRLIREPTESEIESFKHSENWPLIAKVIAEFSKGRPVK